MARSRADIADDLQGLRVGLAAHSPLLAEAVAELRRGLVTPEQMEAAKNAVGSLRYAVPPEVWTDIEQRLRPLFLACVEQP